MEFSDIALAKLLETMPELGNLILTFEDVTYELEEDSGIQVGVFILRSGVDLFFVPVISKGDSVYPIDSIFFDSKKKFFPLTRKVVGTILASSQIEQGKPSKIPKTVPQNPSVSDLINPPRTGKFVYASTSRLADFLASLPGHIKQATFEKIAAEKSVYDSLDKMFSLKAIFDALKVTPIAAGPRATNEVSISVVTAANPNLNQSQISDIIHNGYTITGSQPTNRIAVTAQDYDKDGIIREVTAIDGEHDYDISFENGTTREAFLPRQHRLNAKGLNLAIFTNGDYALAPSFISVGESLERREVLTRLFDYSPPVLLRDVAYGDKVVVMTNSGEFLGPFDINGVTLNQYGVEAKVGCACGITKLCGYRNFGGEAEVMGKDLYLPYNAVVIRLSKDVTFELDKNINSTHRRREINSIKYLGSELNLGYDGVEFMINGKSAGLEPKVMEHLVVAEGIEPSLARTFVKQAQETKFVKIYLTKKADVEGNIPQYGEQPNMDMDVGMNGAFMPNVQMATQMGDSQVTEATIISELLQVPDMFEQISEYLPDIEEAIDKLGRILFMSRVHINKLAETTDSDSVFALLAQLKSVYRMLGDNYLRLQQLVLAAPTMPEEE